MKEQLNNESLQAFIEGTDEGFKAIYSLYYQQISYFTYKLINQNKQESEDITAITFAKLFRLHKNFTTQNNIRAFLYITARNSCFNFLTAERRKKERLKTLMNLQNQAPVMPEFDEALQHEMIEGVMLKEIYAAVEELPYQCRRVFKMIYYEGRKTAEIAELLSITPETVRNHKSRALSLLRLRLSDNQLALALLLWSGFIQYGYILNHTDF